MLKVRYKFRSHLSLTYYVAAKLYYILAHAICHTEQRVSQRVFFFFYLLWMFKLVYKINFFHQVSSNCSD